MQEADRNGTVHRLIFFDLCSNPPAHLRPTRYHSKRHIVAPSLQVLRAMQTSSRVRPARTLDLALPTTLLPWMASQPLSHAVHEHKGMVC
jgi:hypothetical protein